MTSEPPPASTDPPRPSTENAKRLPDGTRAYLTHPSLLPLWAAARKRLESNGVRAAGALRADLDEAGTDQLAGLLGRRVRPGTTIKLADLDTALRASAAGVGLVSVLTELGGPLHDRRAHRNEATAARAATVERLEAALAGAGLAGACWAPQFVNGVRTAGLLTRAGAGVDAAIRDAGAVLSELVAGGAITDDQRELAGADARTWGLAELASRHTGDAHGLDQGRATSSIVLRAIAAAHGIDPPRTARDTRELWARVGVLTDEVSGTALVWNLRPPANDPWSAMLRARADLGLVTHLTVHELRHIPSDVRLTAPGTLVSVCENPQVLQAAAAAGAPLPLICTYGNPATAGWKLLERLQAHAAVRYHGDFDWNGVAIAGRVIAGGARPWRFGADDYLAAVEAAPNDARLALHGRTVATPWSEDLAHEMTRLGVAVHEETLLDVLVVDLT
jgi:uncharacterized protein (TIGR02679 family)